MARRVDLATTLAAAVLLIAAACPQHARAAEGGAAGAKPAAAAPRFSVKSGTCKEFLELPEGLRGLVVAWTAGRYHTLERWILDQATATKVVSAVEQACQETPEASFRYQVVGEIKKLK